MLPQASAAWATNQSQLASAAKASGAVTLSGASSAVTDHAPLAEVAATS